MCSVLARRLRRILSALAIGLVPAAALAVPAVLLNLSTIPSANTSFTIALPFSSLTEAGSPQMPRPRTGCAEYERMEQHPGC
jgi:hypothetical protein